MKRLLVLLLIGIVAYAFFLLLYLPALVALNWYGPLPGNLQFYGVRGTVIHGQADALIWPGGRLDQFDWRLAPGELLAGRLGYQLNFSNPDHSSGHAIISRGLSGDTVLSPLKLQTDLKTLSHRWTFAKRFGGELSLQLQSLTLDAGRIIDVHGGIAWSGAHLRGSDPVPLGGFQARFEAAGEANDGFEGPIGDNGGPLSVTGRLQLRANGHWTLKGKLALRDPANTALAPLLSSLGRAGSDGKITFEWSGQLPPALLLTGPAED
jgi:hypothetical protein